MVRNAACAGWRKGAQGARPPEGLDQREELKAQRALADQSAGVVVGVSTLRDGGGGGVHGGGALYAERVVQERVGAQCTRGWASVRPRAGGARRAGARAVVCAGRCA